MEKVKEEWKQRWNWILEFREMDEGDYDEAEYGLSEDERRELNDFYLIEQQDLGSGWTEWSNECYDNEEKVRKGTERYNYLVWLTGKAQEILDAESEANITKLRAAAAEQGDLDGPSIRGELEWCPVCESAMSAVSDENGIDYICYVCGYSEHEQQ